MNRGIRRVGDRGHRPAAPARRAAHLPAGHRRQQPRRTTRATSARTCSDFTRPRGEIISADGKVARAARSRRQDEYEYQRDLPATASCSRRPSATSPSSSAAPASRSSYNDGALGPRPSHLRLHDLARPLLGKEQTGNVVLSLDADVQLIAKAALGEPAGLGRRDGPEDRRRSSRCTRTRASTRSPLAGHDPKAVQAYWQLLNRQPGQARLCPARTASATHRARRSRS